MATPRGKIAKSLFQGPDEAVDLLRQIVVHQPHATRDLEAELMECLRFAKAHSVPVTLLAGGTNILVKDGGIRGLVITLEGSFKDLRTMPLCLKRLLRYSKPQS